MYIQANRELICGLLRRMGRPDRAWSASRAAASRLRLQRGFARSDANRRVRSSGSARRGRPWPVTRSTLARGPVSRSWNRWAMTGTGVGLVVLIFVVTVGSLVTSNAATTSARSVRIGLAYALAAGAIAAEQSLEREYRLQPAPAQKEAHVAAEATLEQAMRQAAVLGDGADRNLAKMVLREHIAYVG